MMRTDFVPLHQTRSATIRLGAPPEQAFEMFTPLGERAWAEGWDPGFLHPLDGEPCAGSVFVTRAAYARVTPGLHAVIVDVRLRPDDDGTTLADVSYALTALTPAGNAAVGEMVDGFAGWMETWEFSINRALTAQPVAIR